MKLRAWLIGLVCIIAACGIAQPRPNQRVIDEIVAATKLERAASIPQIQHVVRLAQKLKDSPGEVLARIVLADTLRQSNRRREALAELNLALKLVKPLKWPENELAVVRLLAVVYSDLGEPDQSLPFIRQGLSLAQSLHQEDQVIWCLLDLGSYNTNTGDVAQGAAFYGQAIDAALKLPNKMLEARGRIGRSLTLSLLGELGEAVKEANAAITIANQIRSPEVLAKAKQHLGYAYSKLNRNEEAIKLYDQAVAIYEQLDDTFSLARALIYEAPILLATGRVSRAEACYARAVPICKAGEDRQAVAAALQNVGQMAVLAKDFYSARAIFQSALEWAQKAQDRNAEGVALSGIGGFYLATGDFLESVDFLSQSLATLAEVGNVDAQIDTLFLLMSANEYLEQHSIAIVWGKRMINLIQSTRKNVRSLDQELQRSYSSSMADRYRVLAELLADRGRIAEAQQVLSLLKDEEYFRFLDVRGGLAGEQVDLTTVEKKWLAKYESLDKDIARISAEYDRIRRKAATDRSPDEQKRLPDLRDKLDAAGKAFREFLSNAKAAFESVGLTDRIDDIESVRNLNRTLSKLPGTPAAVFTLVTKDGVRLILSLPNVNLPRQAQKQIKFEVLNRMILSFRQACEDPTVDPRPLGAELYDLLIRPIEGDLKGAGVDTILWSLDSTLRYVPMWALYDRESGKYLIEKYPSSVFTPRTVDRLAEDAGHELKGASFGVSKPHTVEQIAFAGLPSVVAEVKAVGAFLGSEGKLDENFTMRSLRDGIDSGARILHIATHFRFRSGDDIGSFLLLGDGTAFTIEQFKDLADGSLANVDLLVLSACETAMGTTNSDGSEFESFALLAQTKGAGAVMASLWPVNDDSTAVLMGQFYGFRKAHQDWSKLACLRAAQLAMLNGELKPAQGAGRRAGSGAPESVSDQPKWVPDPTKPYAHPFFWAPFVLIGNWK